MKNNHISLKTYLQQVTDTDPALMHSIRIEQTLKHVEGLLDAHLTKLIDGNSSFEALLTDLRTKYKFNDEELVEEIENARNIWKDLEAELKGDISRHKSFKRPGTDMPRWWNPLSKCNRCKIGITLVFIALGGALGVLAFYSAGTAVPAYFVAVAAALGISVSTLYAILGAVVAGTIGISGIPREICRAKNQC